MPRPRKPEAEKARKLSCYASAEDAALAEAYVRTSKHRTLSKLLAYVVADLAAKQRARG